MPDQQLKSTTDSWVDWQLCPCVLGLEKCLSRLADGAMDQRDGAGERSSLLLNTPCQDPQLLVAPTVVALPALRAYCIHSPNLSG